MAHTVNAQELDFIKSFIETVVPYDESFTVKLKAPSEMSIKELKLAIKNAGLVNKAVGFSEKYEFVKLLEDYYSQHG